MATNGQLAAAFQTVAGFRKDLETGKPVLRKWHYEEIASIGIGLVVLGCKAQAAQGTRAFYPSILETMGMMRDAARRVAAAPGDEPRLSEVLDLQKPRQWEDCAQLVEDIFADLSGEDLGRLDMDGLRSSLRRVNKVRAMHWVTEDLALVASK